MPSVGIWTIESDNDKEVVGHLALKLAAYLGLEIEIRTLGKKTFSDVAKRVNKDPDALTKAVRNYLIENNCIIFVLDTDSPIRLAHKRQDPHSAISQIERVTDKFGTRVYVALAVQEVEAWLLVDCVGICCYFAGVENSSKSRARQEKKFQSLLKKYARGNTELIVEAEAGGKGPKEYLIELSERIIRTLQPQIGLRVLNQKKYRESLSPALAKYIEIGDEALKRNASLQRFGEYLTRCSTIG